MNVEDASPVLHLGLSHAHFGICYDGLFDANTNKFLWNICQYHSDDFISQ